MTASGGVEFGWRKYYYYVRNHDLELEYHKPSNRIGCWRSLEYLDPCCRGTGHDRSHRLVEGDNDMLQGRGVLLGEFLDEVLGGRSLLTAVTVSPKKIVANVTRRLNPRPFEAFSHWT